jgi:hypothetical protein
MDNSGTKYKMRRELIRKRIIGTNIKTTTNSRKVPYTTLYELNKDISEKKIIDEINRLNMNSDYGV